MAQPQTFTYQSLMHAIQSGRELDTWPDAEECKELIEEAHLKWISDGDVDVNSFVTLMEEKFGIDINNDAFQFADLELAYKHHCHVMIAIYKSSIASGLILADTDPNAGGNEKERINKAYTICREMYTALRYNAIALHRLDELRNEQLQNLPDFVRNESYIDHDIAKNNSFQNLLQHVLHLLGTAKYRRHEDKCYKEIVTREGFQTKAWKPFRYEEERGTEKSTILAFIGQHVTKETAYDQWKNLTNPHDNGARVTEHLIKWPQYEFPTIEPNRYIFSFSNGLYNMKDDMFYPHQIVRWQQNTTMCTGLFWHRVERMDIDEFKDPLVHDTLTSRLREKISAGAPLEFSQSEWDDDIGLTRITGITRDDYIVIDESYYQSDSRYYDDCEKHWPVMAADITRYRKTHRGWGESYKAIAPSHLDVAVKYFNQPFRFEINENTERTFDVHAIKLPEIELLFDTQNLEPETQKWTLIFLARLFYPVLFMDKWQCILFIKGVAGSGKSTLAKLIRYCFSPEMITTLSANIEGKFGLSAIYKGLICICSEVRENFGLDQGEWQAAASGEEVQINEKHKTAFQHIWTTPMFFLGNVYPNYIDTGGSVARRMMMIEFNHTVKTTDPYLFDKVTANVDLFMRKANYLYLEAVRTVGHKDVWAKDLLPPQIHEFHNGLMIRSNTLLAFLTTTDSFEFHANDYWMPVSVFRSMYIEFLASNQVRTPAWNKDHYQSTFENMALGLDEDRAERQYLGEMIKGPFLLGIRPKDATHI